MNQSDHEHRFCDFEDRVLATFLDGEPAEDLHEAAAHLEACPTCAETLRKARALDALLAAQTRTDIDDAVADRLLAGLRECAPEPVPIAFWRRRWAAAAAILLLASLAAAWMIGRANREPDGARTETAENPSVPAPVDPVVVLDSIGKSSGTGFAVPEGVRRITPASRKKAFSDADLLARLNGERVRGLTRRKVADRVRTVLSSDSNPDPELTEAAARWLLGEVRRGFSPSSRIMVPGRLLLASRGRVRRDLIDLFREHEELLDRMARYRLTRGEVDREFVSLIGAVGARSLVASVGDLGPENVDRCADQARRTGDRRCVSFLVDLYLETATGSPEARKVGVAWFSELSAVHDAALVSVLKTTADRSRRKIVRDICEELLDRLGLTETHFFWFARSGGAPMESFLP